MKKNGITSRWIVKSAIAKFVVFADVLFRIISFIECCICFQKQISLFSKWYFYFFSCWLNFCKKAKHQLTKMKQIIVHKLIQGKQVSMTQQVNMFKCLSKLSYYRIIQQLIFRKLVKCILICFCILFWLIHYTLPKPFFNLPRVDEKECAVIYISLNHTV